MSGKYFIFSIRRPVARTSSLFAALVLVAAFGFLVSPSDGIPVAVPNESSTTAASISSSTTVKILIPPSAAEDDDDDAIIIEGGNSTNPNLPREPFHPMDCFMEKVKGPCRAIIDMWFFNTATKTCEEFQYSGCGGNGNRFLEKNECENRCAGKAKSNGDQTIDEDSDSIVIDAGSDDSSNDNGTCPEFDGCGPLKCAEITDEKTGCKKCACSLLPDDDEDTRMPPVGSVSGTPSEDEEKRKNEKPADICSLPEVRGDCRAMVTRYRYDTKSKSCIMFHFGGCNSNGNNFVSEEKCMAYCQGQ